MINDDERAALERELAAALADLSDVNLDDERDYIGCDASDTTSVVMTGLARRDLDEILHEVSQQQIQDEKQASSLADEGGSAAVSAWELLLQSVDQSDSEFFGAMTAELDDIRATILTSECDSDKPKIEATIPEARSVSSSTLSNSTAWSRLAQQRWEKQQQEAAQWLSQLELDVERLNDEQQRREHERAEAMERALMDREEQQARRYAEQLREHHFRVEMRAEDAISIAFNCLLRQELQREQATRCELEKEDEANQEVEQYRKQQAIERQLLQEETLVRRLFNNVLISLVERHRVKQAEKQKRLELERKREMRENSLMRAEEAQTRRWLAQTRAIALERDRLSNRIAMGAEDELAHEVERLGRRNRARELRSCREMQEQEAHSARAWAFATRKQQEEERRRVERTRAIERGAVMLRALWRFRCLRLALETWSDSVKVAVERENEATTIQRWWRERQRRWIQPEDDEGKEEEEGEMKDEWGEEADGAAMVVQSAFRGFFVRRKFQAALDLAREVGGRDDDSAFREVNLDELIELPPELADGWEDPVLPRLSRRIPVVESERGGDQDDDDDDDDDDGEEREDGGDEAATTNMSSRNNNLEEGGRATAEAPAVKEANLAASLWSKMLRTKQKQRRAVDERAWQQNPTYRVQKPLHPRHKGKPPQHHGGPTATATGPTNGDKAQAAPTIAWTTSSNPPKPKVRLPSLVERLRKKTAAERTNG